MNTKKVLFSSLVGVGALIAFIGMFLDALVAKVSLSAQGQSISTSTGKKFLELMKDSQGSTTLQKVTASLGMIFGIIAIVLAIALVVFAVINILNKGEFKKVNLILSIVTIVVALVSFISICILCGDLASKVPSTAGLSTSVMPAIGSFMILIGAGVAGAGAILNAVKKD